MLEHVRARDDGGDRPHVVLIRQVARSKVGRRERKERFSREAKMAFEDGEVVGEGELLSGLRDHACLMVATASRGRPNCRPQLSVRDGYGCELHQASTASTASTALAYRLIICFL